MPPVTTHEQTNASEEEPIDAIPLRHVPFARTRPQPSTQTQAQATVIVKSEPQPFPQYQFGPRMTKSRAKGLINFKPVKQPKGTVFNVSDDSDSLPESPVAKTSTSRPAQADHASLNTLADAATEMNTQSIPPSITERLQTASVGFMLRKSVDEAIATSNEVLGLRSASCAPTISMIHSQPSMAAQTPKKGSSSLKHCVSAALAAMDRMIKREPECDPAPAQPPVTTTYTPTFTRNIPFEINFMNSPCFTSVSVPSSTIEPTLFNHASTSKTPPVETTPVETIHKPTHVQAMPKTGLVEPIQKPTPVETTTTSPLPSPNQPTTTPSTPTEPIPLPQTVSIQELDFVLGLSPTNPSLTPFEHNEDPSDPQNTPVTQTPPPSPHSTQPFMPSPNQPTSPLHSGTHDYYEGAHSAHHSPVHSSPHMGQEREEVDTGASLRKKVPRRKRMTRMETRSSKRRREDSERLETEKRAPRRRRRT
ncbi:DNA-directed RNA polymerase II subunit RPB1-like [Cynara cardunculus var. scolymus]|uniref:DNA-directed RNA polymerase II subunit RPB1-like n=1 Tax=Cynara cardunculus var. scolymus TaxID=59895 RepID=UPI000D626F5E|nr:DNA-directed RNA polymerase II subunit RPB1-like [Cynara cardunculus var. scolymus]